MPSLSRPWTCLAATLAVLAATGCTQATRDPDARVIERADRAVAELDRLRPRLAKAGTPGAEELAANLAAVREGLAALPPPGTPPATETAAPPEAPKAVRTPDHGWRLGVQAEAAAWRVRLRGAGSQIDDVGPPAYGIAIGLEQARPFDARGEWDLGGELVATQQTRSGGQYLDLFGFRPVIRGALAVSDTVAVTARPILEVGQAVARLGSPPGGVLDRAGIYAGFGFRLGCRIRRGTTDVTVEAGWRRCVFQGRAGSLDYRVDAYGPEAALGLSWRH